MQPWRPPLWMSRTNIIRELGVIEIGDQYVQVAEPDSESRSLQEGVQLDSACSAVRRVHVLPVVRAAVCW